MSVVGGRNNCSAVLSDLLVAAGISPLAMNGVDPSEVRVSALVDDSRDVEPGSCFVAISGARADGDAHIKEAIGRGATAVVSGRPAEVPAGVCCVRVVDARSALARLAAAYHGFAPGQRHSGMRMIGVTGTNGKSTTCALLRGILRAAGHSTALLGTIHYDLVGEERPAPWTTPPPLALYSALCVAARHGATHAVMEVSSHALAQSRCDGLRFGVGVFTNLSGDHLDYHGDTASYLRAKKRLFDMLDGDGMAVVNFDDDRSSEMVSGCRAAVVRFGLEVGADVRGEIRGSTADGSRFAIRSKWGDTDVALHLAGRHNVSNALAAAGAALALEVDLDVVRRGLESVERVAGRLQRVDTNGRGFSVFVDYAHTDDALVNVLRAVRPLTEKRLICVFGCGGDRDRSKRPRMARAVAAHADSAIVTSDNPRSEDPMAIIEDIRSGFSLGARCAVSLEPDRRVAIERAMRTAGRGDTVLIAGKGHEDYQIVGDTRRHFDDIEVATAALACLEVSG